MCRKLCESVAHQTGTKIGPARGDNIIEDWKNEHGGGVVVMSAEQSRLGRDVDVLICDDPITEKTYQDAAALDAVDLAIGEYTARAGRKGRRGSVLVLMSRWTENDPIGRRLSRKSIGWTYKHSPAIIDMNLPSERAFAPDVMSLEEIQMRRRELAEIDPGERYFWAQFMNDPLASLDSKVREPKRYTDLPDWPGYRYAMGVDLAYKAGERTDWFACVIVKWYGSRGYIVEVIREKPDFNLMENILRSRWERYGRCPIFSYVSGPEEGAIKYFTSRGIPIQGLPARWSKAYRAQKTIDRWNDGGLLVPFTAPWERGFVARARMFTGAEKMRDDDEFDALVSVCDPMANGVAAGVPYGIGQRRLPRREA